MSHERIGNPTGSRARREREALQFALDLNDLKFGEVLVSQFRIRMGHTTSTVGMHDTSERIRAYVGHLNTSVYEFLRETYLGGLRFGEEAAS